MTQYLTEQGLRRTFDFLSSVAPGSQLVFTFLRKSFIDGTDVRDEERRVYKQFCRGKHPLFRVGLDPEALPAFLQEYGWQQVEQVGAAEYVERYLEPASRGLPVLDTERAAHAVRVAPRLSRR